MYQGKITMTKESEEKLNRALSMNGAQRKNFFNKIIEEQKQFQEKIER